ncbi:MAG: hypothetical protein CL922_03010 [Deltaproteobacteria bacterium]|nr:hypothetical protein [Deltaproteobacteria bacterium]
MGRVGVIEFARQFDPGLHVLEAFLELEEGVEFALEAAGLPDRRLGGILVVPEVRGLHLLLDGGEVLFQFRDVKDTSGVPTSGP